MMEIVILFLAVVVVVLLFLFVTLKNKENALKQEFDLCKAELESETSNMRRAENALKQELDLCKSEHKFALSELEKRMNSEVINRAGTQFQQWRDKECEVIRLQQLDIAKREAVTLLEEWKYSAELTIRADAIHRSQSVIVGKVTEHLIPYLPKFKYNPKDVRFFGDPIDLIVFDGLNDGYVNEIVFIEVKTGKTSRLNRRQQEVRDAIKRGRVKWVSMRVNHDAQTNNSPITIDDSERFNGHKSESASLFGKLRDKS